MEHPGPPRVNPRGWRAWVAPAPDSLMASTLRLGRPQWVEWVHLAWTAWVFITPLFSPAGYDLRWLWLTLLSYPLFLLLYAATLLRPAREALRYALAMAALAIALLPWYPSGMTYFVFGCVMLRAGRPASLRAYLLALSLLNTIFVASAVALGYPWQAIAWMPVVTTIIGLLVHAEQVGQRKDAALRLSHDEVRRLAALAERERIGRDLHDLLGHTLSLVALKSDLAGRLVDRDPAAARGEIDAVSRVAREALAQVRSAVSGIRSAGIAAELASAKLLLECDGVSLRHDWDESGVAGGALPAEAETALAMVVREAVTNVQRHARARSAEVVLRAGGGGVVLRVSDDGRGGAIAPGNGMDGMRARIEALGGRLAVDSVRGRGTVVEAWLPLARSVEAPRPAGSGEAGP